jgi:hypothetical protein
LTPRHVVVGGESESVSIGSSGPGDDFDCRDFPSQAAAQASLDSTKGDPNRLDLDRDGVACETVDFDEAVPTTSEDPAPEPRTGRLVAGAAPRSHDGVAPPGPVIAFALGVTGLVIAGLVIKGARSTPLDPGR